MSLPLEDFFNDVIGKAQRGLRLDDETLAAKASVSLEDLHAAKNGTVNPAVLSRLAVPLNLHGPSLIAMAGQSWHPADVALDGLAQFNTTWDDMTVNAYLVWDPKTKLAAAFDTGASAQPMLDFIHDQGLTLALAFLTHTHPDHIADLNKLSRREPARRVHQRTRACHWRADLRGGPLAVLAAGRPCRLSRATPTATPRAAPPMSSTVWLNP